MGRTLAKAVVVLMALLAGGCRDAVSEDHPPAPTATSSALTSAPATAVTAAPDGGEDRWADGWPPTEPFRSTEQFDVLIKGGQVVDGTGRPAVRADVLLKGGEIAHVGVVDPSVRARRQIDAAGRVVAPGFIDAHSHGDPLGEGRAFIAQGVTTICVGQDGRSPSDDHIRYWAKRVGRRKLRLNVAALVGHGTVRNMAGIGVRQDPTAKQLAKMAKLVAKEMDAGGWGLSTGLEYTPGRFATTEELIAIAKPVGERGGIVMSHLRSEDDDQIDKALDELIAQGKGGGARVHVAHIKVVYGKGAARAKQILARLQAARDDGVEVTADIYPYVASYTNISIVFPAFAKPPNRYRTVVRERRDELAQFLRERIALRGGPEATLFGTEPFRGKTLAQAAAELKKPFEDVLIDDIGPGGASAAYFVMDEALQAQLLLDRWVMISTDGGSHSRHPRGYGSFARILHKYVQQQHALSLEEAIRKMTGLTAQTFGFDRLKRGTIRAGHSADLVIFDPAKVIDRASYEHPSELAEGMDWVFINGVAVREEGENNRARPGRLLLRTP